MRSSTTSTPIESSCRPSAGGHLSLITGMLPDGTALDNNCDGTEKLKARCNHKLVRYQRCSRSAGGPNRKKLRGDVDGSQPMQRRLQIESHR